jgi:hypothetical protein
MEINPSYLLFPSSVSPSVLLYKCGQSAIACSLHTIDDSCLFFLFCVLLFHCTGRLREPRGGMACAVNSQPG